MKMIMMATVVFLFAMPAICAEIDGQWVGVKDGPDGKKMELNYRFRAEKDNTLIGLLETRLGGGAISEGKIDGKTIEFKIIAPNLTVINKGTLSGDEIYLTETSGTVSNKVILKRVKYDK